MYQEELILDSCHSIGFVYFKDHLSGRNFGQTLGVFSGRSFVKNNRSFLSLDPCQDFCHSYMTEAVTIFCIFHLIPFSFVRRLVDLFVRFVVCHNLNFLV